MSDRDRRRLSCSAARNRCPPAELGLFALYRRLELWTGTKTATLADAARKTRQPVQDIRPFHVSFPDSALTELRNRVKATIWPEKETSQ